MRSIGLAAVLAALLIAPIAMAHTDHGGSRTFILTGHDRDTANGTVAWFAIDDRRQANPSPLLEPGERVLLHFVNAGERNHTLVLGQPVDRRTDPISPGNETSLTFQVPSNTSQIAYEDPGWTDRGMQGHFAVNASREAKTSPGPGLVPAVGAACLGGLLAARLRP